MNSSNIHQYPSALYSSVSEVGYRTERFTGEVLRSGARRRGAPGRSRLGAFRLRLHRHA